MIVRPQSATYLRQRGMVVVRMDSAQIDEMYEDFHCPNDGSLMIGEYDDMIFCPRCHIAIIADD
jgi:hypothetical protein